MHVMLKASEYGLESYGVRHGVPYKVVSSCARSHLILNDKGKEVQFYQERFDVMPEAPVAGRKDDSGKLDFTLLDDMPRALAAVVEVMQWAITKKLPTPYERSSWLGVQPERYKAAQRRHDSAAELQASDPLTEGTRYAKFELDAETKLLHAAHKATSALMELELILREKAKADAA